MEYRGLPLAREVVWWNENHGVVRAHLQHLLPHMCRSVSPSTVASCADDECLESSVSGSIVYHNAPPRSKNASDASHPADTCLAAQTESAGAAESVEGSRSRATSSTPSDLSQPQRVDILPRLIHSMPDDIRRAKGKRDADYLFRRSLFVFPSDVLCFTAAQFAESLDAAGCPADVREMLLSLHSSQCASANISADAAAVPAKTSELEKASCGVIRVRQSARYNVHHVVPLSQHPLFRANALVQEQRGKKTAGPSVRPPTPPPRLTYRSYPQENGVIAAASANVVSTSPATGRAAPPQPLQRKTVAVAALLSEECVARESIVDSEALEAIRHLSFPLLSQSQPPIDSGDALFAVAAHPALQDAMLRLRLVEEFRRRNLYAEEEDLWQSAIRRPYSLFLFAASPGSSLKAVSPLRRWIARWRGKRRLHAEQQHHLLAREARARADLIATDDDSVARFALFRDSVTFQESSYRCRLEGVATKAAYAAGLAAIRLEEHCARFTMCFGYTMAKARVRARLTGYTLFHSLCISESARRDTIALEEARWRAGAPLLVALHDMEERVEPLARRAVASEEASCAFDLYYEAICLLSYYSVRDVERYEAVERTLGVESGFASLQPSATVPDVMLSRKTSLVRDSPGDLPT